jgi:hypothetical protein
MRKDDAVRLFAAVFREIHFNSPSNIKITAVRLNAAVIKGSFSPTHRHEKRRRQAPGCRCY